MATQKKVKWEKAEEPEAKRRKKKTQRPLYDQVKSQDEGIIDLLGEPSVERHSALLAHAASDKQRANLALGLQQVYGNTYVQHLLSPRAVQAKFTVNPPGDEYEKETDRIAVVANQTSAFQIQRQESGPTPGIGTLPPSMPGYEPGTAVVAAAVTRWVLTGLTAIGDEVQKNLAEAAAQSRLPEIEKLLTENPGLGVLVTYFFKKPDPRLYDPAVRGLIGWTFLSVGLEVAASREEAIAIVEATGRVEEENYIYRNCYSWIPPLAPAPQ